jgi:hypothetical protein
MVTFLFTDVEGSTRRWEADADETRAALAVNDSRLRIRLNRVSFPPGPATPAINDMATAWNPAGAVQPWSVWPLIDVRGGKLRRHQQCNGTPFGGAFGAHSAQRRWPTIP